MGELHLVDDVGALLADLVLVALVGEEEAARARAHRDRHLARGAVELDGVHLAGGLVVAEQPDLGDVVDEGAPALVVDVELDVHHRHVDLQSGPGFN